MTQTVTFSLKKQKLNLDLTQGSSSEESQAVLTVREKTDQGKNKPVCETNKIAA